MVIRLDGLIGTEAASMFLRYVSRLADMVALGLVPLADCLGLAGRRAEQRVEWLMQTQATGTATRCGPTGRAACLGCYRSADGDN
jgi:hypothetical protein